MSVEFTADRPLLLAGCGNMGAALLQGWIASGIPANAIRIIEPSGADRAVAAGADAAQVFTSAPTDGIIPRASVLAGLIPVSFLSRAIAKSRPGGQ